MILTSSAFANGEQIPTKYGYNFKNINPPLEIDLVPENTKSFVIIMDDPDAMTAVGKIWIHWIICNIPPETKTIPENFSSNNAVEGKTDFDEIGYGGPAPPDKTHTYIFKMYALDSKLNLSEGYSKTELEKLMKGHILEETKLTGIYSPS